MKVQLPDMTISLTIRGYADGHVTAAVTRVVGVASRNGNRSSPPGSLFDIAVHWIQQHFDYEQRHTQVYTGFFERHGNRRMQAAIAPHQHAIAVFLPRSTAPEISPFHPIKSFKALPNHQGFILASQDELIQFLSLYLP